MSENRPNRQPLIATCPNGRGTPLRDSDLVLPEGALGHS